MKAIMYHYVRKESSEYPNFKFLHIDDFKKQLDFFEQEYSILHPTILLEKKVGKGVLLTFDDGVKDHIEFVLPELKKRNLSGIFYISTGIYSKNKLLDVHRLHLLLGKFGGEYIYQRMFKCINEEMLIDAHVEEFKNLTYISQKNDEFTVLVKRMMNYFIGYQYRETVMDILMKDLIEDEQNLFNQFYLSENDIRQMHDAGMMIGSHSVHHKVMSKLPLAEQENEISNSFGVLEKITGGLKTRTFCYPYGGFHTFTPDTEKLLKQYNCNYAFNVEPRDIEESDLLNHPQALPRYDCNLFPHGKIWKN
jgi:peptidoglycan/xylan/chitin deacetylase (PgdA/CDA1 family)